MASQEHSLRMRIAREHSKREPDFALIANLQRERAVARIKDFVVCVLSAAPELTIAQRQEIADLVLVGGGEVDGATA